MIAPVEAINNTLTKIAFGYDIPVPVIPAFNDDPNKRDYAGEYTRKDSHNEKISLTFEGNLLYFSSNGSDRYAIHSVHGQDDSTDFVAEYKDERFTFLRNDLNKVDQVIYTNANGDANLFMATEQAGAMTGTVANRSSGFNK
jgi:hypothetical protein